MKIYCPLLITFAISLFGLTACVQTQVDVGEDNLAIQEQAVTPISPGENLVGTLQAEEQLQLTATEVNASCHTPNDLLRFKLTFTNLSAASITFQTRFYVSFFHGHGDLTYDTFDAKGELLPLVKYAFVETGADWTPPKSFTQLPALGQFETELELKFPATILDANSQYVPIPAGVYRIKFYYTNAYQDDTKGIWVGKLTSNYVEICMKAD